MRENLGNSMRGVSNALLMVSKRLIRGKIYQLSKLVELFMDKTPLHKCVVWQRQWHCRSDLSSVSQCVKQPTRVSHCKEIKKSQTTWWNCTPRLACSLLMQTISHSQRSQPPEKKEHRVLFCHNQLVDNYSKSWTRRLHNSPIIVA